MNSSDLVRYITLTIVAIVVIFFGTKFWNARKDQASIVEELKLLTNPTASYEQKFEAEARSTLFRSMHQLYLADHKHDKPPVEVLATVFDQKASSDDGLFSEFEEKKDYTDPKLNIIRQGLERNYEFCRQLGLFGTKENLDALKEGSPPEITKGPAKGKGVIIHYIIDPQVSPGVERLIPNMVIGPPPESDPLLEAEKMDPTDLEITQAKNLAKSLANAGLFEYEAERRIFNHYESISKAKSGEVDPEPNGKRRKNGKREDDPEPEFNEDKDEDEDDFEEKGTSGDIQDN